ncbi:hypothetical protein D915_006619 [Fasciola hepatica]|uniref:Apple domain-containing protein n=1 Tax=Fasciola hepatica TaxID=6192 RepID=A0A4E0RA43_FASHE|nr:hypothetical protein D915_006619 [Fasciola hepatica]
MLPHFDQLFFAAVFLFQLINAKFQLFATNKEYHHKNLSFCDAHRECFIRGKLRNTIGYMIGREYLKLKALKPFTSDIWLNYHALLHQNRPREVKGWIFGDTIDESSDEIFQQYVNIKPYCTTCRLSFYTTKSVIRTTRAGHDRKTFACGYRLVSKTTSEIIPERFLSDRKRGPNQMSFFDQANNGCFGESNSVTLIECAMRCHLNVMCRSFYFNTKSAACRYTLFIDSLMSLPDWENNADYWLRFSRPMWTA